MGATPENRAYDWPKHAHQYSVKWPDRITQLHSLHPLLLSSASSLAASPTRAHEYGTPSPSPAAAVSRGSAARSRNTRGTSSPALNETSLSDVAPLLMPAHMLVGSRAHAPDASGEPVKYLFRGNHASDPQPSDSSLLAQLTNKIQEQAFSLLRLSEDYEASLAYIDVCHAKIRVLAPRHPLPLHDANCATGRAATASCYSCRVHGRPPETGVAIMRPDRRKPDDEKEAMQRRIAELERQLDAQLAAAAANTSVVHENEDNRRRLADLQVRCDCAATPVSLRLIGGVQRLMEDTIQALRDALDENAALKEELFNSRHGRRCGILAWSTLHGARHAVCCTSSLPQSLPRPPMPQWIGGAVSGLA